MKKTFLHFSIFFALAVFMLGGTVAPVYADASSPGKTQPMLVNRPAQHVQTIRASDDPPDAVYKKVYVIVYDPILSTQGGQHLSTYEGWNDYATLNQDTIDFFKEVSGNKLNYSVYGTPVVLEQWPEKIDGFKYDETTEAQYLAALTNSQLVHHPDEVNYTKILNNATLDICGKVNSGLIDEVWIYNAPNFGFYESRLAGPGAYKFNAPPVGGSLKCNRMIPIMGPSVERPVKEAIHNFMHRAEWTMTKVYGSWNQNTLLHNWDKFSLSQRLTSSYFYSGCGNTHFPPNARNELDYENTVAVPSNCDDFRDNPNSPALGDPPVLQSVTCNDWGCSDWFDIHTGFFHYWFSHLPSNPASNPGCGPDNVDTDWWDYLASPYLALYPSYACQANMHIISGSISANPATPSIQTNNITLTYTDGTAKTVTGDGTGNYFLMVSDGWSGTVSPVKEGGYTFSPANISYTNVTADQYSQNYVVSFDGPEIDIKGKDPNNNNVSIPDGNATPATRDSTDFGVTQSAGLTALLRTFTIYNTGPSPLNLTDSPNAVVISGANADEFSVTAQPTSPIAPSGSSTFTIKFDPSASGVRTATISIANNDWTEGSYDFAIQGESDLNEMDVKGTDDIPIPDSDTGGATASFNGTDFGTTAITGGSVSHTFTISNVGYADLNLSDSPNAVVLSGTNPGDFSVTVQPTSPVAPSESSTFTIVFDPTDAGRRVAFVSIANDDVNENPYGFLISGDGHYPEMDVRGKGISIPDDDSAASPSDDTDFGDVSVPDEATVSHTFTILNTSDVDLSLTGSPLVAISGTNAADFTVTTQPNSVRPPGQSTTFTISFKPGAIGPRSAGISIENTDLNENPYNFTIQGFGLGPVPSVSSVTRAGASSTTNAATVDFTVTFSEAVTGVDTSDFALTAPTPTGASIVSVSGSPTTYDTIYTVTVNTGSGTGSLHLDVVDDDTIENSVPQTLGGGFTSGESYNIDKIAPRVVSSLLTDPNPTNLSSVHFAVHFSEPVIGVNNAADFHLTTSLVTNTSITSVTGSGANYTVTVNTGSGNTGSIRLGVLNNGTIFDTAGNPLSGPFNGGQTYSINKPKTLTLNSLAMQDGWVSESKETSGLGGAVNSKGTIFQLGDDASNRQYRAILAFDTSSLPDNAKIKSATLKIKQSGAPIGSNPFNVLGDLLAQIKAGSFGSPALQLDDFNNAASADLGAFNRTPVNLWYSKTLSATSLLKINKVGLTQFRLYFSKDDNNNKVIDAMKFVSGNSTSGQPQLIITYTMP